MEGSWKEGQDKRKSGREREKNGFWVKHALVWRKEMDFRWVLDNKYIFSVFPAISGAQRSTCIPVRAMICFWWIQNFCEVQQNFAVWGAGKAKHQVKWIGLGGNWNTAAILSKREKNSLKLQWNGFKECTGTKPFMLHSLVFRLNLGRKRDFTHPDENALFLATPLQSCWNKKQLMHLPATQQTKLNCKLGLGKVLVLLSKLDLKSALQTR